MRTQPHQHQFPLVKSGALLSGAAALLYIAICAIAGKMFEPDAAGTTAINSAALIVGVSAVIGLLPVAWLGPHGLMPTVYGYFIGAGVRVLVALVATVVAITAWELPAGPWTLSLMGMYLPLLFLETALVGRFLLTAYSSGGQSTPTKTVDQQATSADETTRLRMETLA